LSVFYVVHLFYFNRSTRSA